MIVLSASFAAGWHHRDDFSFSPPADEDNRCVYARQFAKQAEAIYLQALENPSHIRNNQALLQICKAYWEWYYLVPRSHRKQVDNRSHVCIHAIFRAYHDLLKLQELSLAPPLLLLPPPTSPTSPPSSGGQTSVIGITLGEVLGEE